MNQPKDMHHEMMQHLWKKLKQKPSDGIGAKHLKKENKDIPADMLQQNK